MKDCLGYFTSSDEGIKSKILGRCSDCSNCSNVTGGLVTKVGANKLIYVNVYVNNLLFNYHVNYPHIIVTDFRDWEILTLLNEHDGHCLLIPPHKCRRLGRHI